MRGMKLLTAGSLAVVMAVSLAACGGDDDDDDAGTLGAPQEQAEEADLVARDNRFEPDELPVRKDQEVTFRFHNDDEVRHNFRLAFLGGPDGIDQDVEPGQTIDITLTAGDPPEGLDFYYFFCKFHQTEGMQGQLQVR